MTLSASKSFFLIFDHKSVTQLSSPPDHSEFFLSFDDSKMSFLGRSGGINNNPTGVNPEKMEMAMTEFVSTSSILLSARLTFTSRLDTVTDFFNRMVSLVTHSLRHVKY